MSYAFQRQDIALADGLTLAAFESTPVDWDEARYPTLVLSNGLGGNLRTWRHVVAHFAPHHRIVTWDYRGLYSSRFSESEKERFRRGEIPVDVQAHVSDALAVLAHFKVERAIFFGWSMGVQLNFELARTQSHRMLALVQICGASGRTTATTLMGRLGLKVIGPTMELFRVVTERHADWLTRLIESPSALAWAKRLGLVAPSLDEELSLILMGEYVRQDFEVYNAILMSLGRHDATDVLKTLELPTLVIAGTRDPMTPASLSRAIVQALPQAQLELFEGASHYLPVEYPERLNTLVSAFFETRALPSGN